MKKPFEKQIEEAVDIGESIARLCELAEAMDIPDDDPVLRKEIRDFQEMPYLVVCVDNWGRHIFEDWASTEEEIMKKAKKLVELSHSFNAVAGDRNPYRYIVYGPCIGEEGINVTT